MQFTVTYRNANGAVVTEAVEAASRGACFAQMKARGITPMNVKEGGAPGRARPPSTPLRAHRGMPGGRALPWVLVALALVLVGGGIWWWMAGREEIVPKDDGPKKPSALAKEVTPAPGPKPIEPEPDWKVKQEEWKRRGFKKNPWGTPIPKDLEYKPHWLYTPEDYARIDPGYEKRHEAFLKRKAANPWKTTADSQLSVLLFSKPGMPNLLVPFDRHFEKQFLKSLETPIVIDRDKDSPELQEQKRQMIEVKIWLKEQLDAGKDIAAILNEERDKQVKLRGLRENLEKALREMEKSAKSVEEVQEYIDSANKVLEEQGGTGAGKIGLPLVLTRMRLEREAANAQGGNGGKNNQNKVEGETK